MPLKMSQISEKGLNENRDVNRNIPEDQSEDHLLKCYLIYSMKCCGHFVCCLLRPLSCCCGTKLSLPHCCSEYFLQHPGPQRALQDIHTK